MKGDTAIMQEIETFLGDYEITKAQFINYVIDLEEWNNDKIQLDKGNIFHYFAGRSVPLFNLLKIANYLCVYVSTPI